MKRLITTALLFSCLYGNHAWSQTTAKSTFSIGRAGVIDNYDGDTIGLKCVRQHKCKNGKLRVRVLNIDTPEIDGKCPFEKRLAVKAKEFTADMLAHAQTIVIEPNQKRVYDRYDRLLASVVLDGVNLGEALIEHRLARPWKGRRENWCR